MKTKSEWEIRFLEELSYLLAEYRSQKDDARIANVLEAVDEILASQKAEMREIIEKSKTMRWGTASESPTPEWVNKVDLLSKLKELE